MLPEESRMTEEESLSIITNMINLAKNHFSETGRLYLLWGWVIFICCIAQYVILNFFNDQRAYNVWYLTWLALIYQFFFLINKKRNQQVKTYTGEIIGYVWFTFIICIFIIVYILIKNHAVSAINPCVLVLYGIPTFLSGIILKFKPLSLGGFICWTIAVIAMFLSYEYQLLLLAVAVLCAWIIPGYLLRARFKKEN